MPMVPAAQAYSFLAPLITNEQPCEAGRKNVLARARECTDSDINYDIYNKCKRVRKLPAG